MAQKSPVVQQRSDDDLPAQRETASPPSDVVLAVSLCIMLYSDNLIQLDN